MDEFKFKVDLTSASKTPAMDGESLVGYLKIPDIAGESHAGYLKLPDIDGESLDGIWGTSGTAAFEDPLLG